jgi:3'(2'), 5'-bisphosphate nucleotidase
MEDAIRDDDDARLARRIAETAGQLLLKLQASQLFDGKVLGAAGDRVANMFIMAALRANRPEDAVLSEEEKDNAARCDQARVWIVDPLDGTREYGEARTDWAVHVALAVHGAARVGAVALPGLALTLCSGHPAPLPARAGALRMLVSRTRPAAEAVAVAEKLGAVLVPMGSAGAKAMAVLRGEADVYLHTGGQYEWDNCAPAAVAQAAGLHVSRVDGSALAYNRSDPYLPDLLICRPELAEAVLGALERKQGQGALPPGPPRTEALFDPQ